jgi:hypothetical protein
MASLSKSATVAGASVGAAEFSTGTLLSGAFGRSNGLLLVLLLAVLLTAHTQEALLDQSLSSIGTGVGAVVGGIEDGVMGPLLRGQPPEFAIHISNGALRIMIG